MSEEILEPPMSTEETFGDNSAMVETTATEEAMVMESTFTSSTISYPQSVAIPGLDRPLSTSRQQNDREDRPYRSSPNNYRKRRESREPREPRVKGNFFQH